jgi:hypothetical protein
VTPDETLEQFSFANNQLLRLRFVHRLKGERFASEIIEATIRLEQAEFFLRRFREAEIKFSDEGWTRTSASVAADPLRAFGEAFYYFAVRAVKALREVQDLDLSVDPVGIRNVRNHMVEHPEKPHGFRVTWWETDCAHGLVLAPGNAVGQQGWTDRGLYPNAQEFIEKLLPKLDATSIPPSAPAEG